MADKTDEQTETESQTDAKPAEAKPAKAKKADAKKADAKGKAEKKGKKAKKGKGSGDAAEGGSIANHPRARDSIRRMKARVGLLGFALAAFFSIQASVPFVQVGLRALGAGVAGYMLAWWFSVLVWRQLIIAEQRAAFEMMMARRAEQPEPRKVEAQPTG